jgi:hypothetical protein
MKRMKIFRRKILLILLGITGALFGASLVLALFRLNGLSYPVILHFDPFRGVDFLGNIADFWLVWGGGVIFVALNTWLAETIFERERFISYFFVSVNVLIALLILIITGVVIGAN